MMLLAMTDAQAGPATHGVSSAGLLLGAMLLVGLCGAYLARLVRVPRVLGYMAAGVALKFAIGAVAARWPGTSETAAIAVAEALRPVTFLALGMILFSIGGVFELRIVRGVGRQAWRISLVEIGVTLGLVGLGVIPAALLAGGSGAGAGELAGFAVLLALASIATAPAATLLVLQEYQAKGPMTDAILSVVGLNNVVSIVGFHAAFVLLAAAGVVGSSMTDGRSVWLDLLMTTVGSVVLGAVVGVIISMLHARLSVSETLLVFLAVMIGLGTGRDWLASAENLNFSYNFLLTCMVAGAVFANIAVDPDKLGELLGTIGVPIYAAFFVLAGFNLHLSELATLGWVGGAYVVLRLVGKIVGGWLGAKWVGHPETIHKTIGVGLLCQAGVAIGLAEFLIDHWDSPLAGQFYAVILGSVALFELIGPIALKWTAVDSGEVKAITLLRRRTPRSLGSESPARVVWSSLVRLIRRSGSASNGADEPLTVKSIMRANVKFLRPEATLDEVMHFVETSRFNHFPVVTSEGDLVGVIEFGDIRNMIYDPLLAGLVTAMDLAKPDSPVATSAMPLPDLLDVFRTHNLGSVPVLDSGESRRVLGLVEQRDLLRALHMTRAEAML